MPKILAQAIVKIYNRLPIFQHPDILREQLLDVPDGTTLTVDFHKPAREQTGSQQGYYRAVVLPIIWQEFLKNGITTTVAPGTVWERQRPITQDETHEVLKNQLGTTKSLSREDTKRDELSVFIDRCIAFANEKLGCSIPPPKAKEKPHE